MMSQKHIDLSFGIRSMSKSALDSQGGICMVQAGTEQLTVLGRHLAALPLPPRIGKMLLYGVLFGCLDPVLTVTCAMAYR